MPLSSVHNEPHTLINATENRLLAEQQQEILRLNAQLNILKNNMEAMSKQFQLKLDNELNKNKLWREQQQQAVEALKKIITTDVVKKSDAPSFEVLSNLYLIDNKKLISLSERVNSLEKTSENLQENITDLTAEIKPNKKESIEVKNADNLVLPNVIAPVNNSNSYVLPSFNSFFNNVCCNDHNQPDALVSSDITIAPGSPKRDNK